MPLIEKPLLSACISFPILSSALSSSISESILGKSDKASLSFAAPSKESDEVSENPASSRPLPLSEPPWFVLFESFSILFDSYPISAEFDVPGFSTPSAAAAGAVKSSSRVILIFAPEEISVISVVSGEAGDETKRSGIKRSRMIRAHNTKPPVPMPAISPRPTILKNRTPLMSPISIDKTHAAPAMIRGAFSFNTDKPPFH